MTAWQTFRFLQGSRSLGSLFWLGVTCVVVSLWGCGFASYGLLGRINVRADELQIYTLAFLVGVFFVGGTVIGIIVFTEVMQGALQTGIALGRLKTDPAGDSETIKFLTEWYEENPRGLLLLHRYGLPVDPAKVPRRWAALSPPQGPI